MINFDYASHTPMCEEAIAEICRISREFTGNVMSAHGLGRAAKEEMDKATNGIAKLLNADPKDIIFTSGASEANNLAIKGIAKAYQHVGRHILSTCLEHPSVSGTLNAMQQLGYEVELLKIQSNGQIDLEHLKTALRRDTVLVCISLVDSELGVIQPLTQISEIVSNWPDCHLHVDAAQAIGKTPVKLQSSTLCISPHKFNGPCGIGVLAKRQGVVLEPLIHGGASSTIYRSGTPTLALAVAGYKALEISLDKMEERLATVSKLQKLILNYISSLPNVRINSPGHTPYIVNLSVQGIRGRNFQKALDDYGICVSVKSACSTDNAPSRPVMAVSGCKKTALSSWRISLSHLNTVCEVEKFLDVFAKICSS